MTNIEKLLVVQKYDLHIAEIEQELRDIPKRKEEELTRLDKHKRALDEALEALKAKQAEIGQFDLDVDARKEKVDKLRKQQLDIKTNKEFKAIELEIKTAEDRITDVEDKELILMEALETIKADVQQKKQDLAAEEEEVGADVKMLDERASGYDGQIGETRQKREAAAGEISDRDWLDLYDRVRQKRLNAIVRLEDGICSGCHMKLPPSAIHDVHKSDTITTCDYCGRLLY